MLLKNEIVSLRPLEPSDVDNLYKWENDPDIWEVSYTTMPYSKYALNNYISDSAQRDIYEMRQFRFVVEHNATKTAVGLADVFDFEPFDMRGAVGIAVNEPSVRGKKIATNAMRLLIDYCFNYLHFNQLYARIFTDNVASIALFKSLGFEECGVFKKWHLSQDGWKDEAVFQLINGDGI